MKWSWKIARVFGIDVYMHATFLLLLAWVGVAHYLPRQNWGDVFSGIVFIVALFGVVILHELGHALTARKFGIRTRDITLLPIGGVARLERMPDDPKQELIVALAGPAVNVVLAGILFAIVLPASLIESLTKVHFIGGDFLANMMVVNIWLAVFNLIPAFPMDGGRVLRALLAMRIEYVRATQIAANIGQGMAFVFGFLGLIWPNPFLVFIALFVWLGAASEASMVQMKSALGGIPISRAMITEFNTVAPTDRLESAVQHILAGFQHDFPVVEDGRLVGVLTRGDLMKALAQKGPSATVREAMNEKFETADPSEMLESAFQRLQTCNCHSIPVVRNGSVVGMVTMDNVGEFIMIQSALRDARRAGSLPTPARAS